MVRALESVRDAGRAAAMLQHPLRLRILEQAGEPISASRIAERIGEPRQNVSYHVRQLAAARLLERAGRHRRGNMYEQRYVATARSYALSPELLGSLSADPRAMDAHSADHLIALGSMVQAELGRVMSQAVAADQRVSTLSMHTTIGFADKQQRAAFAEALSAAIAAVVGRFSIAAGDAPSGEYRLVLGCYPKPQQQPQQDEP